MSTIHEGTDNLFTSESTVIRPGQNKTLLFTDTLINGVNIRPNKFISLSSSIPYNQAAATTIMTFETVEYDNTDYRNVNNQYITNTTSENKLWLIFCNVHWFANGVGGPAGIKVYKVGSSYYISQSRINNALADNFQGCFSIELVGPGESIRVETLTNPGIKVVGSVDPLFKNRFMVYELPY